jgi:hypothetical protein
MKRFLIAFVLLTPMFLSALPGAARAEFTLSGSTGLYWSQPGVALVSQFDRFDTYFSDSAVFSGSDVGGSAATIGYGGSFSGADGWKGIKISDTVSQALGPAVTNLNWDYYFSGSFAYPQKFDINYFRNNIFVGHESYTITGYQAYRGGFDMVQYTHAPIPAAGWLLGTGLVGLIGIRRRLSK